MPGHIQKRLRGIGLTLLGLGLYYLAANFFFGEVCPSKIFLGLPCPACGMTRAALLLLRGDLSQSFSIHPMLIPAIFFVGSGFWLKLKKPELYQRLLLPAVLTGVLLLTGVFCYRLAGRAGVPPLDIYEQSIYHTIKNLILQ